MREEDHVADGGLAQQDHHQPVDPHPEAAGGRHPVLHGAQVVLIYTARLLVARFARSFAVVFRTGVPLLRALDIVAATLDHKVLAKEIGLAKLKMSGGSGIADLEDVELVSEPDERFR